MTLVAVALGWLGGMAAIALWGLEPWYGLLVSALLAPAVFASLGRDATLVCLAAGLMAFAGALRLDGWLERDIAQLPVGRTAEVTGVIDSEPDPGLTTTRYRLDVDAIDGQPSRGAVLITLGQFAELLPGDHVTAVGELSEAPVFDDFDYRGYLRREGITATMLFPDVTVEPGAGWNWERQVAKYRIDVEHALQRSLPEPEASLAAGIAFGMDQRLPPDLYDDFRDAGLAHLVAVSGANVTYVAAFVFLLLTPWLGVRLAAWPAAATILLYLFAAGLTASVIRAGIMAGVFLLGAYMGRQRSSLAALGAAVIFMTAFDPSAAVDIGFQLSVAATAGLIVFAPWIRAGLEAAFERLRVREWVPGIAIQAAALSLAASLATLPLIWFHFGRISLIGPLANVVVEPLFVVAFALSLVTAAAGLLSIDLGWVAGLAAYYPLAFICWFASWCASLPFAAVDVEDISPTTTFVVMLAFVAAGAAAYLRLAPFPLPRDTPPRVRTAWKVGWGALAGGLTMAVIVLGVLPLRGPGELVVAFLDVGQGDAILVTTPSGKHVVIDGGPSGIQLARELGATLPHWERDIAAAVLTHPQQDHVAGLPELFRRFDVEAVYDNGVPNDTAAYDAFAAGAGNRQVVAAGDHFEVDGVTFEVLWPPPSPPSDDLNNGSVVVLVTYGEVSFVLTGDIEEGPQAELLDVRAAVLKLPHHGAATSLAEFFDAVGAGIAVIPVGEGNTFGHPADETLRALGDAAVYRTDIHGRVTIRSDGETIDVSTER